MMRSLMGALAGLVLAAGPAFAQTEQARLQGRIVDATGAALPGAALAVTDTRTGETRTTQADAQGRYLVAGLKPSLYDVKAELSGFAATERRAQRLAAGQELGLDLTLRLAGVSEALTVSGQVDLVDRSSARLGANVNERELTYLPVNGRQMSQLYLQAPGALNSGTGTTT